VRLRAGVASDRGLVRQTNEDSYLARRGLYAVCDGMGGARAGEVASQMACQGLLTLDPASAGQQDLRTAIVEANLAITRRSLSEEPLLGMGTTLTAVLAGEGSLSLAHVGDSRAYLLHDGSLTQLTSDHSWVGEMVRRGELTPAQAAIHPHRSVITRALGTDGDVEPDIFEVAVEVGDRILLCSDGLTGMVSDPEIAELLRRDEGPQAVAGLMVQAALAGGGEDNVTVVVVDVLPPCDQVGADREGADRDGDDRSGHDRSGDEILVGPSDRGVVSAASSHRSRRPTAAVRERLARRTGPFLRPVASRAGGDSPPTIVPSEPQPPSRARTRRTWVSLVVVVVVVVAIAAGGFAVFNSTVYYVGMSDGTVALYQGLPGSFLGIELSSVIEQGTVAYDSLAPHLQERVSTHDLVNKEQGQLFLRTLGAQP
jgi:serine/threonine protein phosphatase PrpC